MMDEYSILSDLFLLNKTDSLDNWRIEYNVDASRDIIITNRFLVLSELTV